MTRDVPKVIIKRGPGMFKSSHCKQCTAHCINISANMMEITQNMLLIRKETLL